MPVRGQKAIEIIACCGFQVYIHVHAAGSYGFQQHVPQCDAVINKSSATLFVGSLRTSKVSHYSPKGVLRMRVVLPRLQRALPRQAAENQNARIVPGNRWKANRRISDHFAFHDVLPCLVPAVHLGNAAV